MKLTISGILIKEDYIRDLRNHVCEVTFTKKDGSLRTMRCTLRPDIITNLGLTPLNPLINGPDYQVRLIDLDKNQWRSFDIKTVKSFKIVE